MKHQFFALQSNSQGPITYFPPAADCLANTDLFDQQLLMPFQTIPGELISPRYAGIPFHLIGHPVAWSDITFRILDDGRYELLEIDGLTGEELQEMLANEEPDDELFDTYPEEPTRMEIAKRSDTELHDHHVLEIGAPTWAQATYNKIAPTDDPESTLTGFQDQEGNRMEFIVASFQIPDVFGYHYLFYAPATRTVMQVFQCT